MSSHDAHNSSSDELFSDDDEDDELPNSEDIPKYNEKSKELTVKMNSKAKVVKLYISHLLDPDKVKVLNSVSKYFIANSVIFKTIAIMGVVVKKFTFFVHNLWYTLFSVDDGTGTLDCFIQHDQYVTDLCTVTENALKETKDKLEHTEKTNPDYFIREATLMMLQRSKVRLDKIATTNNTEKGDLVELYSNFSECYDKRCCFTLGMIKHRQQQGNTNTQYYQEFYKLYENQF